MEPKDPNAKDDSLEPNSSAEDFFSKMNHDFRRPKPSEEAVAAALHAIQALAGDSVLEASVHSVSEHVAAGRTAAECPKCGGQNSSANRFCGFCGTVLDHEVKPADATARTLSTGTEQHVHHHHHHHHYFPEGLHHGQEVPEVPTLRPIVESLSADETPAPPGHDAVLRKLVQEWALLCNGQRLDELTALYAGDAVLIRPGTSIVRGHGAIKDFLQAELEAGLGDVQLECTDVGTLGDVACIMGVNRMLVPISPANRQERTGKFLMVARREGIRWGILADIWCIDAPKNTRSAPKPAK